MQYLRKELSDSVDFFACSQTFMEATDYYEYYYMKLTDLVILVRCGQACLDILKVQLKNKSPISVTS